jgi:hypothetical protein
VGKQIQLAMNAEDERSFLLFLKSTADIQIFEAFAPSSDGLFVEGFDSSRGGHWSYYVWNKQFDWAPQFGTVGDLSYDPAHIGWKYISNSSLAPLLEVNRSDIAAAKTGRLYWGKDFAAPNGLNYDAKAFSSWVDQIWRWVRKHGQKVDSLPLAPYFLPSAYQEWKAAHETAEARQRDA